MCVAACVKPKKIYANDKVSMRRIEEENARKRLEGNRRGVDITNSKAVSVQMDGERKSHTSPTHTREQRAKLSTGTVARYDAVMNSDNKELQKSMLSGDVKLKYALRPFGWKLLCCLLYHVVFACVQMDTFIISK